MAKRPPVTLPPLPFDWPTIGQTIPAGLRALPSNRLRTAPLARGAIERGDIDLAPEPGPDGAMVARRARVWRTALPPCLKMLPPVGRVAMLDYAAACEAVAGAGAVWIGDSAGGGGTSGTCGPAHAKMVAAQALARMDAALAGSVTLSFPDSPAARRQPLATATLRDVARWAAVEGLTRAQMLARAGASGEAALDALAVALVECAARLARVCGYIAERDAAPQKRNGAGA